MITQSESYSENVEGKTKVDLEDKLIQVYEYVFVQRNQSYSEEIYIGECCFTYKIKELLLRVTNLLSNYTAF